MLSDIGSWASIIGLILTLLTLIITSRVNQKVNGVMKSRADKTYFNQRVETVIEELKEVKALAENDSNSVECEI